MRPHSVHFLCSPEQVLGYVNPFVANYKYASCLTSPFSPISQSTISSHMNAPTATPTNARLIPPASRLQNASSQVDYGAGPQSESRFLLYLRGIGAFVWVALEKMLMSQFQSIMAGIWLSFVARLQGEQRSTRLIANEAPQARDLVTYGQPSPARTTTSPRKVSWSYLRGLCTVSTF